MQADRRSARWHLQTAEWKNPVPVDADLARLVADPTDIGSVLGRSRTAGIAGEMNHVVAIEPRFVSGLRLVGWCA
jgi:hypothetical protein